MKTPDQFPGHLFRGRSSKCSVVAKKILLSPSTVVNIDRSLTGTNLSLNLFFWGEGEGRGGRGCNKSPVTKELISFT